jgi:hypothetical protein
MGVKLVSSGGGSVEINPPATASNFTATMPAGTGNVVVNGVNGALVSATAVASTSGTSIDFTGIPSWVRRVTVMFNGVSTSGTSVIQIQIGTSSGIETTGYVSTAGNRATETNATTGFILHPSLLAADFTSGEALLSTLGSNVWVTSGSMSRNPSAPSMFGGTKTTSGTLDRVRITTVNGTDTFDAGSINIMYE